MVGGEIGEEEKGGGGINPYTDKINCGKQIF